MWWLVGVCELMEKVVKKPITTIRHEHYFECDLCGKPIGMSLELEDGYYEELGLCEIDIYIDDWYRYRKILCEECQKIIASKVVMALIDIGFERE